MENFARKNDGNGFSYPPSVQSDLFYLLKEEQRAYLQPILRVMKKAYQVELCVALLDFLQTGIPDPPYTHEVAVLFHFVIERAELHPLVSNPYNL